MYKTKNGLWRETFRVNGIRKDFSGKTKAIVREKIAKWEQSTSPTFENVALSWKEKHWDELNYGSYRTYSPCLNRCISEFGPMLIDHIPPRQISIFLQRLSATYAKKTVGNHRIVLNKIFSHAIIDWNVNIQNPVRDVPLPKGLRENTRDKLQPHIIDEILSTNEEEFQLAFLQYYTGTRTSEALGIQFCDVDFSNNLIRIDKAVQYIGNTPRISTPKTKNAYRYIPLLPQLKKRIQAIFSSPDDYIISGNSLLSMTQLNNRWIEWARHHNLAEPYTHISKSGKKRTMWKVCFQRHQIRHEFASALVYSNVLAKDVQLILGHSDIRTTLTYYTHAQDNLSERVAKQLLDANYLK